MGATVKRGIGRNTGRRRHRRSGLNADINVTPFVDVMLVLLIVFMVVANELASGVAIELPKTDAQALPAQSEPITVSVDSQGKVFIQDTEISLDELVPKLVAISGNGYDERIFIRGDGQVNYEAVMKVMARVNAAGFSNLGLVTDPVSSGN